MYVWDTDTNTKNIGTWKQGVVVYKKEFEESNENATIN
jgi:hypothetical protein